MNSICFVCRNLSSGLYACLLVFLLQGAEDSMMDTLEGTSNNCEKLRRHVLRFALRGMRSLVLGCRYLTARETQAFKRMYSDAMQSVYNKDERAAKVALEFEQRVELLGIAGMVDRLQYGVPQVIKSLLDSGARFWLLTGDNPNYAVHVGYRAKLLKPNAVIFNADLSFPPGIVVRGSRAKKAGCAIFERYKLARLSPESSNGLCLVVTGTSLSVFLSHQELQSLFLLMTCSSDAVLCARVTPAQKAQLVEIVKTRLSPSPVSDCYLNDFYSFVTIAGIPFLFLL